MRQREESGRIGIVIATRNRCADLIGALDRLRALAERPPIVVVDNGSADGTAAEVRRRFPDVRLLALGVNRGAWARTEGARRLSTPYVAFSDDDSWWAPGALDRAVALLDTCPRLGLIAGRVLVGPEEREDPVCRLMAGSPLPRPDALPGPPVLGFLACGAIVRREAFLGAGGFHERFGIGGEEELLALDLATAGWWLAYVPDIVAHHHPSARRSHAARRERQLRNALWAAWLRRPWPGALRRTARLLRDGARVERRRALVEALGGLPWVLRERRPVPPPLARALNTLDAQEERASA